MKSQLRGSKVCAALRRAQKWVVAALGAAAFFAAGTASAASVAKVGDAEYETLEAAIAATAKGDTVTLVDGVSLGSLVKITDDLTLDLNGHDLNATCGFPLWILSGDVTFTGKGTISASGENVGVTQCVVFLGDTMENESGISLKVGADVSIKTDRCNGIVANGKNKGGISLDVFGTVEIASPVEAAGAISGVGSAEVPFNVTLENGSRTVAKNSEGVYFPGLGTLTIKEGSYVSGVTGVEVRAGTLNVEGGTIVATAAELTAKAFDNGPSVIGAAVAVSQHTTNRRIDVTISGGTLKGVAAVYVTDEQDEVAGDGVSVSVAGGVIDGDVVRTSSASYVGAIVPADSAASFTTDSVDGLADGYLLSKNDDGTYGVKKHVVAKVGDAEYNDLADALKAALAANDGVPVEIVDDVTFADGGTWTPVPFSNGETLVVHGNGKTISNMQGSLLGSHDLSVNKWNGSLTVTDLKFVNPKDSYTSDGKSGAAVVLPAAYGIDVTLDGVVIEGADVRAGTDSYVAGFIAWCNGVSAGGKKTVTLRNCAIRNSTLVSCGSVGGLVAFTTATPDEAVALVVENCEVTGNTIVGTEIEDGKPRTDIVGAVVGTIGAGGASVSATMTDNSVYGSASAYDAETLTKDAEVTTIYGRNASGGTLTVTGGTYDNRPFAEDASWATVAEGCALAGSDADGWKVEYFIKANGVGYASLEAAFAAAEPDADGVVTYEIGGKAMVDGEGWVQILKSGLAGVKLVKFVGTSENAEICLTKRVALLAEQSYDVDVEFTDLTLTKPNLSGWVQDINFGASNFTTWLRNVNAAENSVTYMRCTFPNGTGNNQYGKTFYNDCTFCNETSGGNNGYNLWVHGGEAEVNGGTFTGKRGVKLYSVGKDETPAVTIKGATFDGLTEKAAVLVSKNSYSDNSGVVTLEDVTVKNCAKGLITRDIIDDEATVSANGTGIRGTFTIASTGDAAAARNEFNLTGGTFTAAVDADYCAKGYEVTANGDGTYGVQMHVVAKVGETEYNDLAAALKAALAANDGIPVEIVDDITFTDGDTWEAIELTADKTLVVNGNGKTVTGLPGMLFTNPKNEAKGTVLAMRNLTFKDANVVGAGEKTALVLDNAFWLKSVTLDGVVIDGAKVRSPLDATADCFTSAFISICYTGEVVMKDCSLLNSTIVGAGATAGLVAYAASDGGLKMTVENAVLRNNVIVCTEIKNGAPRRDIVGSVFATANAPGTTVSATVDGNMAYGSRSAVGDEEWTVDTDMVTTIYGRNTGGGTLTITGGEYDSAPFAEADASWAKVAEWSKLVEQDGVYKVVDAPVTLGSVAARQRYPWNGLVDVTFELKSNKSVRLFIVAEYASGTETVRLPMTTAKLVNEDGTQSEVNVSDGSFTMAAQETAKTVHVVWDSTAAVPARQSGVTFRVYAK